MPTPLTTAQIQHYIDTVKAGGVSSARAIYTELYSNGYTYAGWAYGVATGSTITGQAALDFVGGTALIGLGGPECRNLTPAQIDKIRFDMAVGYLETLKAIAIESGNIADRDVDFRETQAFHATAFEASHLTLANWTLTTPMELIRREYGEEAVEAVWQQLRDTGGDGADALFRSTQLLANVAGNLSSNDPEARQMAQSWINNTIGQTPWSAISTFVRQFKASIFNAETGTVPGIWEALRDPLGNVVYGMSEHSARSALEGAVPPRRDPLVLDLDGDGIETTSPRDGTRILFDHDADGVRTGTGWIRPDDGWLVLDRNGNGTIDTGRELFGVDTIKRNGQFAADGFDALRDFDTNSDGRITAADSVFANLRIWRDLNQDGISQTNELATLAANNITAIGVDASNVRIDLGNGNVQTAQGTFTRSNGTTGRTGETNSASANLDLLVDTFYRQFTDRIPLTQEALALPDLRGSGRVRDLREAISLSPDLGNWVRDYAQQTSRQAQFARLDGFIERWADTSQFKSLKAQADLLAGSGVTLTYNVAGLYGGNEYDAFIRKLGIVERFMGFTYGGEQGQIRLTPLTSDSDAIWVAFSSEQVASINLAYDRFKADIYQSLALQTRLSSYLNTVQLVSVNGELALDFRSLETMLNNAIAANPNEGILDSIELVSAIGLPQLARLNWDAGTFLTMQLSAVSSLNALALETPNLSIRFANSTDTGFNGTSRADVFAGNSGAEYIQGADGDDILAARGGNDTVYGGYGNDLISGGRGNDTLDGFYGNDTYVLSSGSGRDLIADYDPTAGNTDTVVFSNVASTAVSVIERRGNDLYLKYGTSDAVTIAYYFHPTWTEYKIEQFRFGNNVTWNEAAIKSRVITNGDAQMNVLQGYNDGTNRIFGLDGDDQLHGGALSDTLDGGNGNDYLNGDAGNDNLLGQAGNDNLQGGSGNDTLSGGAGDDLLDGSNGNDTLNGGTGNDTLHGGYGNDTYFLSSGSGLDLIADYDSTAGNTDTVVFSNVASTAVSVLERRGNDLYLKYGTSDAVTVAYYFDPTWTEYKIEQFRFSNSVTWNEAAIKSRVITNGDAQANSLFGYNDGTNRMFGLDGDDQLHGGALSDTLDGGNGDDFLNGSAGNDSLLGQAGNDGLHGSDGNDTLSGGAGDDLLDGSNGNDTLNGGTGNDTLYGGYGNDTYVLSSGSGLDLIADYDPTTGNTDTVVFSNIASTAVSVLERRGNDLYLKYGTSDAVTIVYYFNPQWPEHKIEQFRFSNNVTWNEAAIKSRAITNGDAQMNILHGYNDGTNRIFGLDGDDQLHGGALSDTLDGGNGDDYLNGDNGNDNLLGQAGNDNLQGGSGNDTLSGGAGDDYIDGSTGNDTLNGGTGNDNLYGGYGNDTYILSSGSGLDLIADYDPTAGNTDTVVFSNIASTAVSVLERRGNDLYLKYGTSDAVTIVYYFNPQWPEHKIEQFRFSNNVTWNEAAIKSRVITNGDAQTNVLYGYNDGTNRMFGLDGDDQLHGGAQADTLDGGNGNDYLVGDTGNDNLLGQAGNDNLQGGSGNDTLRGGTGDDYIDGSADNDSLFGDSGNDTLVGGTGNDTYIFAAGSGADTIYNYDPTLDKIDTMAIWSGITASQVWFRANGSDLTVSAIGTRDIVTIANWFGGYEHQIEMFRTSDGRILEKAEVDALLNAMAPLSAPALGQTTLPAAYQSALNPLIEEAWKTASSTTSMNVIG